MIAIKDGILEVTDPSHAMEGHVSTGPDTVARGFLRGRQVQPWEIHQLAHEVGITDGEENVDSGAICLAECQGFDLSYNDNLKPLSSCKTGQVVLNPETFEHLTVLDPATGKVKTSTGAIEFHPPESLVVVSRDVGMWQINILAELIGTKAEADLYDHWNNATAMLGKHSARGWEPWAAFTSGVYLHDTYMNRAIRGHGNFLARRKIGQMQTENVPTNMGTPALFFPTYPHPYKPAPYVKP